MYCHSQSGQLQFGQLRRGKKMTPCLHRQRGKYITLTYAGVMLLFGWSFLLLWIILRAAPHTSPGPWPCKLWGPLTIIKRLYHEKWESRFVQSRALNQSVKWEWTMLRDCCKFHWWKKRASSISLFTCLRSFSFASLFAICIGVLHLDICVAFAANLIEVNGVHWSMSRCDIPINFLESKNEWKVSSFAWYILSLFWQWTRAFHGFMVHSYQLEVKFSC